MSRILSDQGWELWSIHIVVSSHTCGPFVLKKDEMKGKATPSRVRFPEVQTEGLDPYSIEMIFLKLQLR